MRPEEIQKLVRREIVRALHDLQQEARLTMRVLTSDDDAMRVYSIIDDLITDTQNQMENRQ